jgi:hypothetical protein
MISDTTLLAGIVAAIVTILTKVIDALMARRRERSAGSLEHRKLLSEDERAFRQAVLEEVKELREESEEKDGVISELRPKLALAEHRASDAERRCQEAERRAALLETMVQDLRTVHQRAQPSRSRQQARIQSSGTEDNSG